jgi:hypothetical protein
MTTYGDAEELFIDCSWAWFEENWKEALVVSREIDLFSSSLVVWLMIVERLGARGGLSGALEALRTGGANKVVERVGATKPIRNRSFSDHSGGYSKARGRLPLEKVTALADAVTGALQEKLTSSKVTGKQPAYFIDGSMFTMERTAENLSRYAPGRNQYREIHNSQLFAVFAHDIWTGLAMRPEYGAYRGENAEGEVVLAKRLIKRLPEQSLLIMDRAFGISQMLIAAEDEGHEVLARVSRARANRFLSKSKKKGNLDDSVSWVPSSEERKRLPEALKQSTVEGRFIRHTVKRKGYRDIELLLFTTSKLPVAELLELYRRRQEIETDFRSLKYTVNLDFIYSKTPDMVEKELILAVAAYNLVRALVARGAKELGIEPRKISFSRAVSAVRTLGHYSLTETSPAERKRNWQRFLKQLSQNKLPTRATFRSEPRKIARNKSQWTTMTGTREEERNKLRLLEQGVKHSRK